MGMLQRSLTLLALGAVLGAASAEAQGGSSAFHWYVGGHGGVYSFRTSVEGREVIPMVGGSILITAKRTGLLLTVEQAFGSDEQTQTSYEVVDGSGSVLESGVVNWTFQGIRRYSATLMAYPVRNPNVQPFLGVGAGIVHTTTNSAGPFAGGHVEDHLSSSGFVSAVGGLEFRLGPVSAFGLYKITTKQGVRVVETEVGEGVTRFDYGEWTKGAHHSLSGGIRFDLGRARESAKGGGY